MRHARGIRKKHGPQREAALARRRHQPTPLADLREDRTSRAKTRVSDGRPPPRRARVAAFIGIRRTVREARLAAAWCGSNVGARLTALRSVLFPDPKSAARNRSRRVYPAFPAIRSLACLRDSK